LLLIVTLKTHSIESKLIIWYNHLAELFLVLYICTLDCIVKFCFYMTQRELLLGGGEESTIRRRNLQYVLTKIQLCFACFTFFFLFFLFTSYKREVLLSSRHQFSARNLFANVRSRLSFSQFTTMMREVFLPLQHVLGSKPFANVHCTFVSFFSHFITTREVFLHRNTFSARNLLRTYLVCSVEMLFVNVQCMFAMFFFFFFVRGWQVFSPHDMCSMLQTLGTLFTAYFFFTPQGRFSPLDTYFCPRKPGGKGFRERTLYIHCTFATFFIFHTRRKDLASETGWEHLSRTYNVRSPIFSFVFCFCKYVYTFLVIMQLRNIYLLQFSAWVPTTIDTEKKFKSQLRPQQGLDDKVVPLYGR